MRSAPSAATTSRTRSSRRAATSSAPLASTTASATVCASVPTAQRHSTAWTPCRSITSRGRHVRPSARSHGRPPLAGPPLFLLVTHMPGVRILVGFAQLGSKSGGMIPLVLSFLHRTRWGRMVALMKFGKRRAWCTFSELYETRGREEVGLEAAVHKRWRGGEEDNSVGTRPMCRARSSFNQH